MNQPTPLEALQLIDNALGALTANREVHGRLQQAVAIVREAIDSKVDEEANSEGC